MPTSQGLRAIVLALLVMLLCACQSAAPAPTSAPATSIPALTAAPAGTPEPTHEPDPVLAPTDAPAPTAAVAPTGAPAPTAELAAGPLPAPLYFLSQEGQIWRMERDGQTRRQLTFEAQRVYDFQVSPDDGALAYVTGDGSQNTLVLLDGAGRAELISGPIDSPVFSPDGNLVAYQYFTRLDSSNPPAKPSAKAGVWSMDRAGGQRTLIQASDPITDTNSPPDNARQYFPVAFAPDGSRLLLGGYYPVGEGGFVAIKQLPSGEPVRASDGCCESAWSADGTAVLIAGGTQIQDAYLGLWRADPASGQATALIDSAKTSGSPLITAPWLQPNGTLYAFAAITEAPAFDRVNQVQLQRVKPDGTLEPLSAERFGVGEALWAPSGSGAVVSTVSASPDGGYGDLVWVPASGGVSQTLAAPGMRLRWGPAVPAPRADACDQFQALGWQAPAQRAARPAVRDIQARLLALGYRQAGQPDGLYGDQTRVAVRAFQQALGLAASGDVDCATWGALLAGQRP